MMTRTRAIFGAETGRGRDPRGPSGFTLIELLIAVAIILLLAALSVPVIGGALANVRKTATTTTITKVDVLLKNRIGALNRYVDEQLRDRRPGALFRLQGPKTKQLVFTTDPGIKTRSSINPPNYATMAGAGPRAESRAVVLARKGMFRKYFPQTWAEVIEYGWPGQIGITPPTANPATESGEVLYLMFTKLGFPGFNDDASDVFQPVDFADTDNNGFPEIVDSWGRPLRFYRWPTLTFAIAAQGSAVSYNANAKAAVVSLVSGYATGSTLQGVRDLDDARGVLVPLNWGVNANTFRNVFHEAGGFSMPMVVSAGLDGVLGLKEPGDTTGTTDKSGRFGFTEADATDSMLGPEKFEDLLDNVTNLNVTAGRTK
jgi:prepilin-type N-terminal cleavage/methylation domain-containing protein